VARPLAPQEAMPRKKVKSLPVENEFMKVFGQEKQVFEWKSKPPKRLPCVENVTAVRYVQLNVRTC